MPHTTFRTNIATITGAPRSNMKRRTPLIALATLLCASVATVPALAATTTTKLVCTKAGATSSAATVMAGNTQTHATSSDYRWSASAVQTINLKSTVTITKPGTYRLRGTITNGQVIVNVTGNGVVRLILAGASITSSNGAAILVNAAPKVLIVLQAGTTNSLTDGTTRTTASKSIAAALYSKASLTISGTGTLAVKGRFADGIGGTDGVIITGGKITVTAKDEGIRGKDYVYISSGTLDITSTGDGIRSSGTKASTVGYVYIGGGKLTVNSKSDAVQGISDVVIAGGTLALTAADDAINSSCVAYIEKADVVIAAGDDAMHSDAETVVRGGTITISKAYEGIEGGNIVISGGSITMVTSDDGINIGGGVDASGFGPGQQTATTSATTDVFSNTVARHFEMSGGTVAMNAQGDGVDIGGSATITGGKLIVSGPTANNNGALDVDDTFLVTGGVVMAIGSSGMAVAPATTSSQASIKGNFASTQATGTIVHVVDGNGKLLASFKSPKSFASIVFSSGAIIKGQAYKVYVGGSVSGTAIGGYYSDGSIADATLVGSLTAGSYTNSGPGGGRP